MSRNQVISVNIEEVEVFVTRYYVTKDIMHNLAHIYRIVKLASEIGKSHEHDPKLLAIAAYFHGNIYFRELEIREFLRAKNLPQSDIDRVIKIAWESQKDSHPETIEGKILHDAHLLEGGKNFKLHSRRIRASPRCKVYSFESAISGAYRALGGSY
jgi:uncharacterized protein